MIVSSHGIIQSIDIIERLAIINIHAKEDRVLIALQFPLRIALLPSEPSPILALDKEGDVSVFPQIDSRVDSNQLGIPIEASRTSFRCHIALDADSRFDSRLTEPRFLGTVRSSRNRTLK